MRRLWLRWSAAFEAMSRRERLLVGAAAVVLPAYVVFALFVEPPVARRHALVVQMEKQRAQIAVIEQGVQTGAAAGASDNQQLRAAEIRKQLAEADEAITALQKSLVPAQRIPVLLREILAQDSAIQLVSLRTLPAAPIAADAEKAPAAKDRSARGGAEAPRGVYKHGVEITLRGSYGALHAYLSRLERSQWSMYWWRAQLAADERAALTMTVTIYTLSLDRGWLEV
jgi:MSHA biogenesis protein MshJ